MSPTRWPLRHSACLLCHANNSLSSMASVSQGGHRQQGNARGRRGAADRWLMSPIGCPHVLSCLHPCGALPQGGEHHQQWGVGAVQVTTRTVQGRHGVAHAARRMHGITLGAASCTSDDWQHNCQNATTWCTTDELMVDATTTTTTKTR